MKNDRIYESVLQRLLKESAGGADLGAYVRVLGSGNTKQAVIYDAVKLEALLKAYPGTGQLDEKGIGKTIVGYIIVARPDHPCGGAWEVRAVWGPGRGSIVYGIGHALSPSGILMSDRGGVSPSAHRGWTKQAEPGRGRKFIPLDDVDHQPGHPNHTEDSSDDCEVHNIAMLDRAYLPKGDEAELFARLTARDDEIFRDVPSDVIAQIRVVLRVEGSRRFTGDALGLGGATR